MTWKNKLISYSVLNWLWNCPESFNRQMNGEKGKKREVIAKAAEYGIAVEDIYTHIFNNRLIFDDVDLKEYIEFALSDKDAAFKKKFEGGYEKCIEFFKELFHKDYTIKPQVSLKADMGDYFLTGYVDYVLYNPLQPIILECKSTHKKDSFATSSNQTKHYAYLYAKANDGIIPETYIFYTRLGIIEKFTFTRDELIRYKLDVIKTFKKLKSREYPLTVNESCFVCPYSLSCMAYRKTEDPLHDSIGTDNGFFII